MAFSSDCRLDFVAVGGWVAILLNLVRFDTSLFFRRFTLSTTLKTYVVER